MNKSWRTWLPIHRHPHTHYEASMTHRTRTPSGSSYTYEWVMTHMTDESWKPTGLTSRRRPRILGAHSHSKRFGLYTMNEWWRRNEESWTQPSGTSHGRPRILNAHAYLKRFELYVWMSHEVHNWRVMDTRTKHESWMIQDSRSAYKLEAFRGTHMNESWRT